MRTILSAMAVVADIVFCGVVIVFLCHEHQNHRQQDPPPYPVVDWSDSYEAWSKNTGDVLNWPQYDGQMRSIQPVRSPNKTPSVLPERSRTYGPVMVCYQF